MGFFSGLFGGGVNHDDVMVLASLQHVMLNELNTAGWSKTSRTVFRTLNSDNGFFCDIYKEFVNNPICAMLKSEDPHAYLMSMIRVSCFASRDDAGGVFKKSRACLSGGFVRDMKSLRIKGTISLIRMSRPPSVSAVVSAA